MSNKWSLEEEKYLIDNWSDTQLNVIARALNRNESSIVKKAQRLGLSKNESVGLKKRWTTEEENILYEFYQHKPISELLIFLPGRTRESIIKKAKQLGVNAENRYWSESEVTYLEEKWGVIPVDNIAKKLNRSKNSILLKAHKIGLREQVLANGEYLTPKDIASILSVGTRTVYCWMDKGCIKYRRLKINSLKKYQIKISSFIKFLEDYQEKWDTRTADIKYIKSCFITCREKGTNQTPEWLLYKMEADKQKKCSFSRKQWTVKEKIKLKGMVDKGISYKEIAALLNRSFYSIQGKITSIRTEVLQTELMFPAGISEVNRL
jgi:DNA-binding CsgD family transcriptional regulator